MGSTKGRHYGYDFPESIKFDYRKFKNTRDTVTKRLNGTYYQDVRSSAAGNSATLLLNLDNHGLDEMGAPVHKINAFSRPVASLKFPAPSTVSLVMASLKWRTSRPSLPLPVLATLPRTDPPWFSESWGRTCARSRHHG
jgi:hypothetical protein